MHYNISESEINTNNAGRINPNAAQLSVFFDNILPPALSCEWDNDGLLCDPAPYRPLNRILLALDVTKKVISYAKEQGCDAIITHHPVIFKPLRNLTSPALIDLIKSDIAVLSYHTRLDIAQGGVNDILAELLGLEDTVPFAGGAGRIGYLGYAWDIDSFVSEVKKLTGVPSVRFSRGGDIAHNVAIVSGSGGDFTNEALGMGVDTFISGEIGYHHMLDASDAGMNALEINHFYSERHILSYFESVIKGSFPNIELLRYTDCAIETL